MRYYLTAAHYRSMHRVPPRIARGGRRGRRAHRGLPRARCATSPPKHEIAAAAELPADFVESMDDDLGVSGALAVVHETVRAGNTALDEDDDEAALAAARPSSR